MANEKDIYIVLLGTTGDFTEHTIVPPVKVIDFGLSQQGPWSDEWNLLDVHKLMVQLIVGMPIAIDSNRHQVFQGVDTMAVALLPPFQYPWLDTVLRDLVIQCLSYDPMHRPGLRELLAEVQWNARREPREFGINAPRETDEVVRRRMQDLLFDA